MSWGLEWLELEPDADERAIKRAYAKRLRSTRPDEDPAGFQQLHEAYQAALDWAQYRVQWDVEESAGDGDKPHALANTDAPPIRQEPLAPLHDATASLRMPHERTAMDTPPADRAPLPDPALDVEQIAHDMVDAAAEASPDVLAHWLLDHPALWSLSEKPRIGEAVLECLAWTKLPIHEDSFDALSACFGWNELGSGVDPLELDECRSRLHGLWRYHHEDAADPTVFREPVRQYSEPTEDDPNLERLRRPWNRLRALLSASLPGRAHDMGEFIARLRVKERNPPLQPRQIAFWQALCRSNEVNGPKMQLALFRSVVLAVGFSGFMLMLGLADGAAGGNRGYWSYNEPALAGGITLLLCGTVLMPLWGFVLWQVGSEHPRRRAWIVRLFAIPLLALVAWWVLQTAEARPVGVVLAWLLAALAFVRLLARGKFQSAFRPWMFGLFFFAAPMFRYIIDVMAVGEIAVGTALLLWVVDAAGQVPLAHARKQR
ncbi:MAG: J domain-containing protein [Stenotrophomonas sp.]|uniref:J domain-containing protein n=1 Tax=Stenotrophomonas sp. TaxID=69392 RepID=UPI003D6D7BAC